MMMMMTTTTLSSFEVSETLNPTRQHNIPEDSNLQQYHHHNPKQHTVNRFIIHYLRGKKTKQAAMGNFNFPLLKI